MAELIVALDLADQVKALELVRALVPTVRWFKVGMELYYSSGPAIIKEIKGQGANIFLDLKLLDIPHTVAQAARVLTRLGINMFTVHASGGQEMISAAIRAANEEAANGGFPRPRVLAVTVLTSMGNTDISLVLGRPTRVEEEVLRWAELARSAGADGIVASAHELERLRATLGRNFLLVTPGIRPLGLASNDQQRTSTPAQAVRAGADYLVVGRPILNAADPVARVKQIISEMG